MELAALRLVIHAQLQAYVWVRIGSMRGFGGARTQCAERRPAPRAVGTRQGAAETVREPLNTGCDAEDRGALQVDENSYIAATGFYSRLRPARCLYRVYRGLHSHRGFPRSQWRLLFRCRSPFRRTEDYASANKAGSGPLVAARR